MSGRFALTTPPAKLRAFFGYVEEPEFPARYNIAPTQPIAIVRRTAFETGGIRHFALARWGFVPAFVKDFSAFRPIFNAQAEGVAEKPSFRNAIRRRRCLVMADGFYLWRKRDREPSQPFLLRRRDRVPLGLAGLYEPWIGADGSEIETACVLTTPANRDTLAIGPRLPALIDVTDFEIWLDPDERHAGDALPLLRPATEGLLEAVPIGTAINAVSHDGADVQAPVVISPLRAEPPDVPAHPAQGTLF